MSFDSLCHDIRQCALCASDLPMGARPVFQATPQARILVAGQAPGRRVHHTGIPFNDPSGDRLRQWMGVSREMFYDDTSIAIIPMGFCYPGTGTYGDLPPRPECAKTWRTALLSHLTNIELTLAIGQHAIRWHLGNQRSKNLTETVRNWKSCFPKIIPLPHPSPRNNIWLNRNPWFTLEVIPVLQQRIESLI